MKIVLDGRLYGLENAGLGRYVNNLVLELSKIDKKNEYVLLLRKKYFDRLKLPGNWKKVLADFRHYSLKEQFALPPIIHKENPDLVHFPHFNVPVFFNGKFVVTIHDLLMHTQSGLSATTLPAPLYFIKRMGYRLGFDAAVKKSEAILVPSFAVKNELSQKYKEISDKINVTYEGLDERITDQKEVKVNSPYFMYAGNAYPHKNLKRLIQAVILLNQNRDKKIGLVVVSARNAFGKRLTRLVRELKADNLVTLMGYVSDAELGWLYKNSLGFVFPSLSEGFGLPGLEAMNSGTLLLASKIPVFKEIYGNSAIYFNPLDFSSIESAMKEATEIDSGMRRKMIENGREFAKRYSWAKMAKQTLEIYENTIKKESSNSLRQS